VSGDDRWPRSRGRGAPRHDSSDNKEIETLNAIEQSGAAEPFLVTAQLSLLEEDRQLQ
jgi:hypothetical protein